MNYSHHYSNFPALKAYIDRIGAEQLNFRRFMVKEYHGSHYYVEKSIIKVNSDFSIECRESAYAPTESEAAAIVVELTAASEFPKSIRASNAQRDNLLASGQVSGSLFTFYDLSRKDIVMCQERRDTAEGKIYIPWTLYESGGTTQWISMEPDGPLPFWKPARRRNKGNVMVHEGAKTAAFVDDLVNNPERRAEFKAHPWGEELADYEHWGAIGGALAMHRCDFSELHREKIEGHVVYVCDNDVPGKEAARTFSKNYGGVMRAVKFDMMFPVAWDLADPVPPALYSRIGTVSRTLMSMAQPATWATYQPEKKKGEPGRPGVYLTKNFVREWVHTIKPEMFCHTEMTEFCFTTQDQFENYVRPFSDVDYTGRLLKQSYHGKAVTVKYEPGRKPGIFFDEKHKTEHLNIYVPPNVRDYTKLEAKSVDYSVFNEFLDRLFPREAERTHVARWCATLVARPGLKMNYGLLLVSETQGVGKTTLADILARLVGPRNVAYTNESSIVGKFNSWAEKQLCVVNEIHASHSSLAYDKLKEVITDKTVKVEKKYMDEYDVDNHVHIFACSNSLRALKLDNTDRRWFIPQVNHEKQPREYWIRLHDWLDGQDGYRKVRLWAQVYVKENGAVEPGAEAPWTPTKQEMANESDSPAMAIIRSVFTWVKETWDMGASAVLDIDPTVAADSSREMYKISQFSQRHLPFVMFDKDGELAAMHMNEGRRSNGYYNERAATICKLAKASGLHVSRERVRATHWLREMSCRDSRVITVCPDLAARPIPDLIAMGQDLPYVNLRKLCEEVMAF